MLTNDELAHLGNCLVKGLGDTYKLTEPQLKCFKKKLFDLNQAKGNYARGNSWWSNTFSSENHDSKENVAFKGDIAKIVDKCIL